MISGTYAITMKTPMGVKKGEMLLVEENGALSGKLTVKDKINPFEGGSVDGDSFHFSGTLQSAMGKMDYECTGKVNGDALEASAVAKRGTLTITGTRKA